MDFLIAIVLLIVIARLARAVWRAFEYGGGSNPFGLARPSVKRLQAEAQRAAKELRQLDRRGRR